MEHFLEAEKKYNILKSLETEHFKCVEHIYVDLNSQEQRQEAISQWKDYCKSGGEGWVIKTHPSQFMLSPTGSLILPMVKVRGQEYLTLIYGIDYLEPECFKNLIKRNVAHKRLLSYLQHDLASCVLDCFLNGMLKQKIRYVAAFYGLDNSMSPSINATL